MKQLTSFLSREVSLSDLRNTSPQQLSLACVGMFLGLNLLIAILALICPGTSYEGYLYPFLIRWGFPPVFALLTAGAVVRSMQERTLKQMGKTLWLHPAHVLFLLLALWMLLSQSVNGWENTLGIYLGTRGETIVLQLEYFLCLFPAASQIVSTRIKQILLRLVQLISLVLAVGEFMKEYGQSGSLLFYSWPPDITSIFDNSNYYGYFLTVVVSLSAALLCAEEKPLWKGFAALCLAFNSVALYLDNTMGAWVGTLAALLFLILALRIRDGRFNCWSLAALAFVLACLAAPELLGRLTDSTVSNITASNITILINDLTNLAAEPGSEASMHAGSGRWIIWVRCWSLIRNHPWIGIGFDGVVRKDIVAYTFNPRPHNEFMQYALFYGIPAAILYFTGCLSVFLRALRYKARLDGYTLAALTAAFGYLVSSFFGVTIYNTAPYLFIMLGLGYVHASAPEEGQFSNTLRSRE